jgi:SAM-dependent methyltransferase
VSDDLGYSRYLADNLSNWDERAPAHAASADYAVESFITDAARLSDVVQFDRQRLGDLTGLSVAHLQCHIGTDTISLARLGATVTGLDFSAASLAEARKLAERAGTPATFTEANVYDAAEALGAGRFDLVYTGIGALCWLPSIDRWAEVVAGLLKPGGRLFVREGHPVLWSLADPLPDDGRLVIELPYFEMPEPDTWTEGGTYVATDAVFTHNTSHNWSHGIGETVTALLAHGMRLTGLAEHDSVPWNALPGHMAEGADGEWRLTERPWRLPLTYTLQAVRA